MTESQKSGPDAAHATDVECPTCGAWKGWACEGRDYGYHAADYHSARYKAAQSALKRKMLSR